MDVFTKKQLEERERKNDLFLKIFTIGMKRKEKRLEKFNELYWEHVSYHEQNGSMNLCKHDWKRVMRFKGGSFSRCWRCNRVRGKGLEKLDALEATNIDEKLLGMMWELV